MTTDLRSSKKFARMIRDYLKNLPEQYADDPKTVQMALHLSDADFRMGLDLLLERKIIVMEKAAGSADAPEKRAATSSMEVAVIGGA